MGSRNIVDIINSNNPAHEIFLELEQYFQEMDDSWIDNSIFSEIYYKFAIKPCYPVIESLRSYFSGQYCCAVPTPFILKLISENSPLIEFGCGNGYWANQLTQIGASVTAIDNNLDEWGKKYFNVFKPEDVLPNEFVNKTLLLIWPSDSLPWAGELLINYSWKKVIYIGEWKKGKMADDAFFDELDRSYEVSRVYSMPNYPGFNDRCYFFNRIKSI